MLVVGAFSFYSKIVLFPPLLVTDHLQELVVANLRCYSCAPCTEFDYSSGWRDPGQWEMDCPLDRYCFKITGQVSNHWPSCCIPSCIVLISIIIYYFWILCPSKLSLHCKS